MNCPGVNEPFTPAEAKRRILAIVAGGSVRFSRHAREQMEARRIDETDCLNVLRGGWVAQGESEHGSWRYQVHTHRICVTVAFRSETSLVLVTAWRKEQ